MRSLVSCGLLLGLVQCGLQEGGLPGADASDTSPPYDSPYQNDAHPSDAGIDQASDDGGAACDPNKPFGAPVLLADIDTSGLNESLRVYGGALSAAFSSNRTANNFDIFLTARSTPTSSFVPASNAGNLNVSYADDVNPTLTEDGLTIYFASHRTGIFQIYQAKRASPSDAFGFPASVPFISSGAANDFESFVSRDGGRLYFASDRSPKVGNSDIYRADLGSNGFFGTPVQLSELSTKGTRSLSPALSADELTIYFGSDRTDPKAKGNIDVWKATRASTNDPFGAPVIVPELASSGIDSPAYLSDDGCTLYISSDRPPNMLEVYSATKPK